MPQDGKIDNSTTGAEVTQATVVPLTASAHGTAAAQE